MDEMVFHGTAASAGLAAGVFMHIGADDQSGSAEVNGNPTQEKEKILAAFRESCTDLAALIARIDKTGADILEFQLALLEDTSITEPVLQLVDAAQSARTAWISVIDTEIASYENIDDEYKASRADDLRDLKRRVLRSINGNKRFALQLECDRNLVVGADELAPSEFLEVDPDTISAIVVRRGSPTSHVAILARGRGIPMLVNCDESLFDVPAGSTVLVDSYKAEIFVNPTEIRRQAFQSRIAEYFQRQQTAELRLNEPTVTANGEKVLVYANVDDPKRLVDIDVHQFDGVGLARTEFLFGRGKIPNEDEQYEIYRSILEWADGRPVTIRTLDAGGDKPIPNITPDNESNPFLGLRGYRLSVTQPELFNTQLRALARAAALGPLKVMIPMVTVPAEMASFRTLAQEAVRQLQRERVECALPSLGMMIEVPAAALHIEAFAADFFSIGTNDLVQYTLAVARDCASTSDLVDSRNPAVLRLIQMVVDVARAGKVELSVCGDMASDPECVPELLKLGVRVFSVAISQNALVKQAIREWDGSAE